MAYINKKDTQGTKPLLAEGELGYDKYVAGGDVGRVYVGTGSENIALAKKSEVDTKVAKVTSTDNAIVRFNGTTGEVQNSSVVIDDNGVLSNAVAMGTTVGSTLITSNSTNGAYTSFTSTGNNSVNGWTTGSQILEFVPSGGNSIIGAYSGNLLFQVNGRNNIAMTLEGNGNLLVGTTTDNGVDKLQVNGTIAYKPKIEKEITIVATLTGGEWYDTGILSTDVHDPSYENVFNLFVFEESFTTGNANYANLWLFQTCGFVIIYTNAVNAPELANLSRTGHASNGGYVKLRWQYVDGNKPAKLQISVQYTSTFDNTFGKTLAIKLRRI